MATTRPSGIGYGIEPAGSFSGKGASAHPVGVITRPSGLGFGTRRYIAEPLPSGAGGTRSGGGRGMAGWDGKKYADPLHTEPSGRVYFDDAQARQTPPAEPEPVPEPAKQPKTPAPNYEESVQAIERIRTDIDGLQGALAMLQAAGRQVEAIPVELEIENKQAQMEELDIVFVAFMLAAECEA